MSQIQNTPVQIANEMSQIQNGGVMWAPINLINWPSYNTWRSNSHCTGEYMQPAKTTMYLSEDTMIFEHS